MGLLSLVWNKTDGKCFLVVRPSEKLDLIDEFSPCKWKSISEETDVSVSSRLHRSGWWKSTYSRPPTEL